MWGDVILTWERSDMKRYVRSNSDMCESIFKQVTNLLERYLILDALKDYDPDEGVSAADHVVEILDGNGIDYEEDLNFEDLVVRVRDKVADGDIDVNKYL